MGRRHSRPPATSSDNAPSEKDVYACLINYRMRRQQLLLIPWTTWRMFHVASLQRVPVQHDIGYIEYSTIVTRVDWSSMTQIIHWTNGTPNSPYLSYIVNILEKKRPFYNSTVMYFAEILPPVSFTSWVFWKGDIGISTLFLTIFRCGQLNDVRENRNMSISH